MESFSERLARNSRPQVTAILNNRSEEILELLKNQEQPA